MINLRKKYKLKNIPVLLFLLIIALGLVLQSVKAETAVASNDYVDLAFKDLVSEDFIAGIKSHLGMPTTNTVVPQCKLESISQASCGYSFNSVSANNFFFIRVVKSAPFDNSLANSSASAFFENESAKSLYGNVADISGDAIKGYDKSKVRDRGDGYLGVMGLKNNFVVEVFAAKGLGIAYIYQILNEIGQRVDSNWTEKTATKKPGEVAKAVDFDYGKSYGLNKAVISTFNGGTTGDISVFVPDSGALLETLLLKNADLVKNLKGKILLKVADGGRAYYIHYRDMVAFYLGRPHNAFAVMRGQGIGIKTADLSKIPVGYISLSGADSDKDGLPDMLEDALGTNKSKRDTDGDGHDDKSEILQGYNPKVKNAKLSLDAKFTTQQKGKILLQVQDKGEAWYVANDGKRYFLGRPADAFAVMRKLSLGISNENFDKLWK